MMGDGLGKMGERKAEKVVGDSWPSSVCEECGTNITWILPPLPSIQMKGKKIKWTWRFESSLQRPAEEG